MRKSDSYALASLVSLASSACGMTAYTGRPQSPDCRSVYEGTYMGLFMYDYRADGTPPTTGSDSFSLTIQVKCGAVAEDMAMLDVTYAQASHPYFGCQGGCTPSDGSALLPATIPSKSGGGVSVTFPNGVLLMTGNEEGQLRVTEGGRILSGARTVSSIAWGAANPNTGSDFPGQTGRVMTNATRWVLKKSAP